MSTHSVLQPGASIGSSEDAFVVLLGELATTRPDVYAHCQRVAELAGDVAAALPARDLPVWEVERAALAHDIGKLAIPLSILNKPAGLTAAERRLMQAHAVIGADLLETLPVPEHLVRLARAHHERLDGTGYPDGLRAGQVPLGAQIIAVCDSWDAMTFDRPYRRSLTFDEAAAQLRAHAGTQWRPDIVVVTLDIVGAGQARVRATSSAIAVGASRSTNALA